MAIPDRGRRCRAVHRLDLHAVGGDLGRRSLHHRADRLGMAAQGQPAAPPRTAPRAPAARGGGARMKPKAIDVSTLPLYAFGQRSIMWWGGASLMLMEGAMFAMIIVSYLYLKGRSPEWPPGYFAPVLFWGTL